MSTAQPETDVGANVCIVGAARTGTHLMNSIICQSGQTTPLLAEAHPLADLAVFYKQVRGYAQRYKDTSFIKADEVHRVTGAALRELTALLREKYATPICVFRAPALSLHVPELYEVFAAQGTPFHFICMLRDPRDAVASMFKWNERRVARGLAPFCDKEEDMLDLFIQRFWAQYKRIVPFKDKPEFLFVRYENLVNAPRQVASEVYARLGLDISRFEPNADWANVEVDLSKEGAHGDCITELYSHGVSSQSVGAFRQVLTPAQAEHVFARLGFYRRTFYPELKRS